MFSQTSTNNTGLHQASQPQLDAAQLALIQQLAQTAKLGNGSAGQPIGSQIHSPASATGTGSGGGFGGPSQAHPPFREDRYDAGRGDPRLNRFDSSDRGRGRGDYHEDRSGYRGNYRGAAFRGRGRGVYNDRDNFRDRGEIGRNSPPRPRRSRSRSPPSRYGAGARRDAKPYSPPYRTTVGHSPIAAVGKNFQAHSTESMHVSPATRDGAKLDEFGRDVRSQSPEISATDAVAQPSSVPASVDRSIPASNVHKSIPQPIQSAASVNTLPQTHSTSATVTPQQPGLDKFDMATFDFTAPSSWEALGKMWQVTYSYLPSQEELMSFVMAGGVIASAAAGGMLPAQYQGGMMGGMEQGWQQNGMGFWNGQADASGYMNQGGVSGYGRQNPRNLNGQQQQRNNYAQSTDAIVLGGDDGPGNTDTPMEQSPPQSPPTGEGGGPGGRMQRVGDKWVFVREVANS